MRPLQDQFRQLISLCSGRSSSAAEGFAETIQRAEKFVHPFINRWCGPNAPSIRAQFQDAIERSRALDANRHSLTAEVSEILSILDLVHRQLMRSYGRRE